MYTAAPDTTQRYVSQGGMVDESLIKSWDGDDIYEMRETNLFYTLLELMSWIGMA
jgi:hypothetical protein